MLYMLSEITWVVVNLQNMPLEIMVLQIRNHSSNHRWENIFQSYCLNPFTKNFTKRLKISRHFGLNCLSEEEGTSSIPSSWYCEGDVTMVQLFCLFWIKITVNKFRKLHFLLICYALATLRTILFFRSILSYKWVQLLFCFVAWRFNRICRQTGNIEMIKVFGRWINTSSNSTINTDISF